MLSLPFFEDLTAIIHALQSCYGKNSEIHHHLIIFVGVWSYIMRNFDYICGLYRIHVFRYKARPKVKR